MSSNLFVYGTLMSVSRGSMGAEQRARLAGESRALGAAVLQARLYDLGRYPGAVESADPQAAVHGEALALDEAAATLAWLDVYEGLVPGDPDPEYARRVCPIRLANGTDTSAWVYLYRWPTHRGRLIAEGRWSPSPAV